MRREAEAAGLGGSTAGRRRQHLRRHRRGGAQARQTIRKARREPGRAHHRHRLRRPDRAGQRFADMDEVDLVIGNDEKLKASRDRALPDFGVNEFEKVRVNDIMSVRETALASGRRARAGPAPSSRCRTAATTAAPSASSPTAAAIRARCRWAPWSSRSKRLADNGYAEIVLTGVDMTSYGADLPGAPKLGKLVKTILRQVPECRGCGSRPSIPSRPTTTCSTHRRRERLMPHLHLSLQSGDDMILKRMKRRHLRAIRSASARRSGRLRPDIVFGADIIAGFPTETEEMFAG
jgi:threonylcarbamoyladenosine tRNA methylthiotransferase MtaB